MAANTNFSIAIHALTVMGYCKAKVNSTEVAQSINANPVIVRRILSKLVKGGLVNSYSGKNGGAELAKPLEEITMYEVLEVLGETKLFAVHENPENTDCLVSCEMKAVQSHIFESAEEAVKKSLSQLNLLQVISEIKGCCSD